MIRVTDIAPVARSPQSRGRSAQGQQAARVGEQRVRIVGLCRYGRPRRIGIDRQEDIRGVGR